MRKECEQCGISAGDLPDLGLEEDEVGEFFEVIDGVTLCAGCAQYRVDIWHDERYN